MILARGAVRGLAFVLGALALVAFPYIELELRAQLPGWDLDVPLTDAAGALLVGLLVVGLGPRPPALPGPAGWALLVGAGLLALPATPDPAATAHRLVRTVVFAWLAWGVAFSGVVARVGRARDWERLLALSAATCAGVLLVSSAQRIASGNSLWWAPIAGLTTNHKTLAVALAPLLPLLVTSPGLSRWARMGLGGLVLTALVASASRTSLVSAVVGLAFVLPVAGRPLARWRGVLPALAAVGLGLALYAPLLSGSVVQLDALRSRQSIDLRAWEMFSTHPWVGMGAGANVRYEMVTFPHYRVNGVDAHGVVAKLASEHGLLGLAGWLATTVSAAIAVRARTPPHRLALWGTFVALHVNLLLSTETFTQTHWVPLGLVWGLALRERR